MDVAGAVAGVGRQFARALAGSNTAVAMRFQKAPNASQVSSAAAKICASSRSDNLTLLHRSSAIAAWAVTMPARRWFFQRKGVAEIATIFHSLMTEQLGYARFGAQGGDWGAFVVDQMGLQAPPGLLAIHTNLPSVVPEDAYKALVAGVLPALKLGLLALAAATLAACSVLEGDKIDYRSASRGPTLEVPPDLTQLSRDTRYVLPGGSVSANAYQLGQSVPNLPTAATAVGDVRIERAGTQRWLVVTRPAEQLWGPIRDFWQENGFLLTIDQQNLGIMANIQGDLRSALRHYQASLEAYRLSSNEPGCATAYHNLGMVSADRELWDEYAVAIHDVLARCSTQWAPWYVVPADHKWYRDVIVARALVEMPRVLVLDEENAGHQAGGRGPASASDHAPSRGVWQAHRENGRAVFEPARDRRGTPVADSVKGRIVWSIPEPEPLPRPPR